MIRTKNPGKQANQTISNTPENITAMTNRCPFIDRDELKKLIREVMAEFLIPQAVQILPPAVSDFQRRKQAALEDRERKYLKREQRMAAQKTDT